MKKIKFKLYKIDYNLILIISLIVLFGLIILYSASYYIAKNEFLDDLFFFKKQLVFSIIGFTIMYFVARIISSRNILKNNYPIKIYILSLILTAMVKTRLGYSAYGANRWIKLPILGNFQPSEFVKIAIIILISYIVSNEDNQFVKAWDINARIKKTVKPYIYICSTSIYVLVLTNHLSAGIIIFMIGMLIIFIGRKNTKSGVFLVFSMISFIVSYFLLKLISSFLLKFNNFRLNRLLIWLNPEKYIEKGGYQIIQGLYAIVSGGFFGKGLGNSIQKLGFIPEVQNDMILTIIFEELGVMGFIILIILFLILLKRIIIIAKNTDNKVDYLMCVGVFFHILIQFIFNICVVLNILPPTGISLPFISSGGSSMLFLFIELGIVLGISSKIKQKQFEKLYKEKRILNI